MDPQPGMMTKVYYTRDCASLFFRRNALMQSMAKPPVEFLDVRLADFHT